MPDVALIQSSGATGVATPAAIGAITVTAGNAVFCVIMAIGTNPTIATPAGFGQINKDQGASLAAALYVITNHAGGAQAVSSALGGVITGWIAVIFEFNLLGNNFFAREVIANTALAQLGNVFAIDSISQTVPNLFFLYTIARPTATLTAQNTGLAGANSSEMWSSSVESRSSNGCALDTFWGSNLAKGPGSWPVGAGLLSAAVDSVQLYAAYTSFATFAYDGGQVGGASGLFAPRHYQGTVGG